MLNSETVNSENHDTYLLRKVLTLESHKCRFGSKKRGSAWTTIAENLEGFHCKLKGAETTPNFVLAL